VLVGSEHLFFIGLVVQKPVHLRSDFIYGKVIRYTLADDLPALNDVYEREMGNGEKERLCPSQDPYQGRARQVIDRYLRAS
jgi:hypothetical protein